MSNDTSVPHRLLKPNAVVVQPNDLALKTLADWVEQGTIDVSPDFQRRDRWNPEKQSALIESFLLNLPIPPIYLAEDETGQYSVIDGRQRLTAICDFMAGRLHLRGLEELGELNGKDYDSLPESFQMRLAMRPLRTVALMNQSDPTAKYLVFKRLNAGGEHLNAQEVRNVAYRGAMNDLLLRLSENEFLRQQLKIYDNAKSAAYRKMLDVEYVLRFLTMREVWSKFSGAFIPSMDAFMELHQYAEKSTLEEFQDSFDTTIAEVERIFGEHAFHRPEGNGWRAQFLAALFDAEMIAVDLLSTAELESLPDLIGQRIIRELYDDPDFEKSVKAGTNTPSRVRFRIRTLTNALREAVAQ